MAGEALGCGGRSVSLLAYMWAGQETEIGQEWGVAISPKDHLPETDLPLSRRHFPKAVRCPKTAARDQVCRHRSL